MNPTAPERGWMLNRGGYTFGPPESHAYMCPGPSGWCDRYWPCRKVWHEFRLSPDRPLTFACQDGTLIQPDRNFDSDDASVPYSLQMFFPKNEYEIPYLHDSAYKPVEAQGNKHGLYFSFIDPRLLARCIAENQEHAGAIVLRLCPKFEFHEVDREFADALLHVGCLSEGASEFKAWAIYRAVRIANIGAGW